MKKKNIISLASALGAAAGYQVNRQMGHRGSGHRGNGRRGNAKNKTKDFYAVSAGSLLFGLLADKLVKEDEPFTHDDFVKQAADKNVA